MYTHTHTHTHTCMYIFDVHIYCTYIAVHPVLQHRQHVGRRVGVERIVVIPPVVLVLGRGQCRLLQDQRPGPGRLGAAHDGAPLGKPARWLRRFRHPPLPKGLARIWQGPKRVHLLVHGLERHQDWAPILALRPAAHRTLQRPRNLWEELAPGGALHAVRWEMPPSVREAAVVVRVVVPRRDDHRPGVRRGLHHGYDGVDNVVAPLHTEPASVRVSSRGCHAQAIIRPHTASVWTAVAVHTDTRAGAHREQSLAACQ